MAQHIYSSTSDPASAPAAIGHHWVNTSSGDTWIATGTSSAADWKKVNNTAGSGITTLNTLTADPQTFATGTSGSDFNISSATATHTFNIPTASGSNRGLLSTADWTTFNGKLSTTLTDNYVFIGNASNVATGVAITGDVTVSNTGVTAIGSGVIVNADINASAAIDASKIADGSVSNTEFQYINSLTSNAQTQISAKAASSITISTTAPLTGGGDLTSNRTIAIPAATSGANGYLTSTDWTTFNNKQDAGNYIDGLSGDVTASGPGTVAATIATNAVTDSKFRQSSGVSIVGRSANSTGDVADITASSNGQFLARASNALSFVTPASTDISDFTEATQDAVGAMISSSDFQYTDSTPLLSAKKTVEIKVLDDSTTLTTGDGKYVWVVPSQFNNRIIIGVFATITTVSSSGTPTIQIRNITDSVDVLSTAIIIDASEYTSDTAATPAVINTSNDDLTTGDRIAIDVDVAGTGAKGLSVGIIIGV